MGRGVPGVMMRVLGAKDHLITVEKFDDLAPDFRRIRFTADTLFDAIDITPTAWIRIWAPDKEGGEKEFQRGYSIVDADPENRWFDMDFVLHDSIGPACAWAERVEPGRQLAAQVMGSTDFALADNVEGVVLIGDASSLPAINTVLQSLPEETEVHVLLEWQREIELEFPVEKHPKLSLHRARRESTKSLERAARQLELDHRQLWAAGEANSLKSIRALAKKRQGYSKDNTYIRAYWTEGKGMGSSR